MKKLFKTCVWFCFFWRLTKGVMPLSGPWRSVWGPPSRPHVFMGLGSSAQSDLLYRAVLAPPKWVGQSPQSKTRNHSISGLRWTSGTSALLTFLIPTPHPQWLSLFNCSPQSGCFLSAWTPDSEELTTSRQLVLFSVLFSAGSFFIL